MGVEKNKKTENFIQTPLRATEALKLIGEEYDRKKASLYSGVVLLIALVYGLLFELNPVLILGVAVTYILCVPQLVYNQRKYQYEMERFNDINSYMSQMAQSFVYTKDVIKSLEETAICFTTGHMKSTLVHAMKILDEGQADIKVAEKDALTYIESRYDCEKLKNLHLFFLSVEELGGECKKEFEILESIRMTWQKTIENIRVKKIIERNVSSIIYAFMLIVCIMMLHIMRNNDLNIIGLWQIQLLNTAVLIGFVVFFVFMDNRLNKSLLINASLMSEQRADGLFKYLENYDEEEEKKKYLSIRIFSIAVAIAVAIIFRSWIAVALSLCIAFAGLNVHSIEHVLCVRIVKKEIGKAFPKWLFDIMLLIQRESVEGAIEKSIETAPPILKGELIRITRMLCQKPHDPDAYMSFLKDFGIQNIDEIMHKLYSLAVGSNRESDVLDVVIKKNMHNFEKAERDSMVLKDSLISFFWIPFLCVGTACMGYLLCAVMTSIDKIIDLVG